jgi:hypothetical protein
MTMRALHLIAVLVEGATGLALIIYPSIVSKLLLGESLSSAGIVVGRIAGFALLALGVACWPSDTEVARKIAILGYNILVALYLIVIGLGGAMVGRLLWPAFAFHAVMTLLLATAWFGNTSPSRLRT